MFGFQRLTYSCAAMSCEFGSRLIGMISKRPYLWRIGSFSSRMSGTYAFGSFVGSSRSFTRMSEYMRSNVTF